MMHKKYFYFFLGLIVLLLTTMSAYWQKTVWEARQAKHASLLHLTCPDLEKGCLVSFSRSEHKMSYHVQTKGQPSPLTRFTLIITPLNPEKESSTHSLTARFRMDGMDMGEQPLTLLWNPQKRIWEKETVLPICVASRHDWILNLTINQYYESDIHFTTSHH